MNEASSSRRNRAVSLALLCFLGGTSLAGAQEALGNEERLGGYAPLNEETVRAAVEKIRPQTEVRTFDGGQSAPTAERARESSADEKRTPSAGWLGRLLERLAEWLAKWLRPGEPTDDGSPFIALLLALLRSVAYLLVAAIVLVGLGLVVKNLIAHMSTPEREVEPHEVVEPAHHPGELASEEYARRATALAQRGDFRGAIRELLLGGMSWTERRGLIRHRKGLTNRDYVRALGREPRRRDAFSRIVTTFEIVYFGRRAATGEGFHDCLQEYRGAFQGS